MIKLIAIMQLVLQLFPLVIQTVKAIEAAFPERGLGSQKLEMVRSAMEAAFEQLTELDVTFQEVWPVISRQVASIVAAFNAIGAFKK